MPNDDMPQWTDKLHWIIRNHAERWQTSSDFENHTSNYDGLYQTVTGKTTVWHTTFGSVRSHQAMTDHTRHNLSTPWQTACDCDRPQHVMIKPPRTLTYHSAQWQFTPDSGTTHQTVYKTMPSVLLTTPDSYKIYYYKPHQTVTDCSRKLQTILHFQPKRQVVTTYQRVAEHSPLYNRPSPDCGRPHQNMTGLSRMSQTITRLNSGRPHQTIIHHTWLTDYTRLWEIIPENDRQHQTVA